MLNAVWIVLLGMAIIFAVLGLLFLTITMVDRLFCSREKKEAPE
ncbi:MAG: OadG family protein [Dehalococcoidia bacterium]|nr:MAG: OadG family protein [Dehalococcoidia bacterium]